MSSVPAVIAKASAIHNPIIYAITHPKYRCGLLPASMGGMEGLGLPLKGRSYLSLWSLMCVSVGGPESLGVLITLGGSAVGRPHPSFAESHKISMAT